MSSQNRTSTLVSSQLPAFIREEHPVFLQFLEKYYEFLEQPGQPVYEINKFEQNYDVDSTRESLLKYFKNKILPSFPDDTELSTERIIKASREFYAKKGTPDSFKFLFRVLFNKDLEVIFPKLQILKASDGKWYQPQAFRLVLSTANEDINLSLLERRKAYGSLSRASCIVEKAARAIDESTGQEIVEIYVSSVNRLFQNGEYIEIDYVDGAGVNRTFSEKIIGALSNIAINPTRRGTRYETGDPVVINGGLDVLSPTARKAIATVNEVTTGSIESVTVLEGGYGFRLSPDSVVDIISNSGVGANISISAIDSANGFTIPYATDAILYKKNATLNSSDYAFDNVALANTNTRIGNALTFEQITLYPIAGCTVTNGGSFFEEEPVLNVISLYGTDYSTDEGFIAVPPGNFTNYLIAGPTIQFVGGSYSSEDNYYIGFRIFVEKHFRTIIAYDGATKTATLNRPFETNVTQLNILSKTLLLDARPAISGMGRLGFIEVLNGGTNYSATNNIWFSGTGTNAAATLAVTGGTITSVTITDRGEGYPTAPDAFISTATGSGAVLKIIMLNDGEDFDVVTSDIGRIKNFNITDRGSDYVSTPNVSLKIYDLYVPTLGEGESIVENDIVYQGTDINTTTFRATVDSYNQTSKILRAFNYSGVPTVGLQTTVYSLSKANINFTLASANLAGKLYPYRYGDSRARANAEFLNGLIKYDGFYLNTDGQVSSDKKLQDDKKYHNYSYELVSEVQYSNFKKTVEDTAHPSGMKLLPVFVTKDNKIVTENVISNFSAVFSSANTGVTTYSFDANNTAIITGLTDSLANANTYLLSVGSSNSDRKQIKQVIRSSNTFPTLEYDYANNAFNVFPANSILLTLESNTSFYGDGNLRTSNNSNVVFISGNTSALTSKISANDKITFSAPQNRINLVKYSQDYSQTSVWSKTNFTLTGGQLAPDGTSTAYRLKTTSSGSVATYLYQNMGLLLNVPHCLSFFVKKDTAPIMHFGFGDVADVGVEVGWFLFSYDFDTNFISSVYNYASAIDAAFSLPAANGYRQILIYFTPFSVTANFTLRFHDRTATATGKVNTDQYNLWGVHLDRFVPWDSYIPTTTTAVQNANTVIGVYTANVVAASGNTLTLNTRTVLLTSNANNITYTVYPTYVNDSYKLIRTSTL
jgi:hypothetical protein